MVAIYFQGFLLGASLIIAIGAQNAFVLTQGVRKKYNTIVPLICSLSDSFLISIGILGIGNIMAANAMLSLVASLLGASFLSWYGFKSFHSLLETKEMKQSSEGPQTLRSAVAYTLAVTLLNPHVYIDTILLIGGISSSFEGNLKYIFGLGTITASWLWFFSLSLAGRTLSPLFSNPKAWRVLDVLITLVMWSMAAKLVMGVF